MSILVKNIRNNEGRGGERCLLGLECLGWKGGGRRDTMLDLHITVGIITTGFVRTSSDVPSLLVMSLKIKK